MNPFFENIQFKGGLQNKSDRYKDYYNESHDYKHNISDFTDDSNFKKNTFQLKQAKDDLKDNNQNSFFTENQTYSKTSQGFYSSKRQRFLTSENLSNDSNLYNLESIKNIENELTDPKKDLFKYVKTHLQEKQKQSSPFNVQNYKNNSFYQKKWQNQQGWSQRNLKQQKVLKSKHQYFQKALKISQQKFKDQNNQFPFNEERTKSYSQLNGYNNHQNYFSISQQKANINNMKQSDVSQMFKKSQNHKEQTQLSEQHPVFTKKVGIAKNKVSLTSFVNNRLKNQDLNKIHSNNSILNQSQIKEVCDSQDLENYQKSIRKMTNQNEKQIKQLKCQLKLIESYIYKAEEEGTSTQDIKRIKKEIKIMKNNFQMAFTSMTDQINRKLVKKQDIMINLSDEMQKLINQNSIVKETLAINQRNVSNLNLTLNSYMKETEERLQNIFNDSFTLKKTKHSFQYGLDLKSSMVQSQTKMSQVGLKIDEITKELKRIKVFHIQQKQKYDKQLQSIKEQILKLKSNLNSQETNQKQIVLQTQIKRIKQQVQSSKSQINRINSQFKDQIFQIKLFKNNSSNQNNHLQHDIDTINQIKEVKKVQKISNKLMQELEIKIKTINQFCLKKKTQDQIQWNRQQLFEIQLKQIQQKTNNLFNIIQIHQAKLKQVQRINQIQTQNIESINGQFQRVINKQIIPKFTQIHHFNAQINFKLNTLSSQINMANIPSYKSSNLNEKTQNEKDQLQKIKEKMTNFKQEIQNLISQKIGYEIKKRIQQLIKEVRIVHGKRIQQKQKKILDQLRMDIRSDLCQTYLVDQEGYLMDLSGCYLLELNQNNEKKRIKLSDQQIYLMEVNGINIRQVVKQ